MATQETTFLYRQLEERKRRLESAIAFVPRDAGLDGLLKEVDAALDRMTSGSYGLCEECHEPIEQDRLLANPLLRYCLTHLRVSEINALQRDLELANEVQRHLLPMAGLRAGGWETSYHYAPVGAVSGDYCDLIQADEKLFFVLGDVSGKGVAASLLMTQLHALFRSLTQMSLPLEQIVPQVNRIFCESSLAGHYATLVCGQAKPDGEVEIHNAGHLPALVLQRGGVQRIDSTGLPLGMFCEVGFSGTRLRLLPGDTLLLFTDGFSEARHADEEYGVDRITNLLRQHEGQPAAEVIAACLNDLRTFIDSPPFDDMTLLAIHRTA